MSDTVFDELDQITMTREAQNELYEKRCLEIIAELCFLSYEPEAGVLSEGQLLRLAKAISPVQAAGIIVGIKPSIICDDDQGLYITSYGDICTTYSSCYGDTPMFVDKYVSETIRKWNVSINAAYDIICTAPDEITSQGVNCLLVDTSQLKEWLEEKGVYPEFFNFSKQAELPYLDKTHPRYTPKLAATIKAWEAMEDENLYKGNSPKKGMEDWLKLNYKEFGLVNADGEINSTAIQEIAKVANWKTTGGAPTTPE